MKKTAAIVIAAAAAWLGASSAQAAPFPVAPLTGAEDGLVQTVQENPIVYRNGRQCQRASSGAVVCRPAGGGYGYGRGYDRGYGRGYGREYGRGYGYGRSENPVVYRNGRQCQRASSGRVICR
ncbi:hypothetical protein GCM10007036_15790 [Alsobacter metallidurans]|uniref:Uncharacterized protein n=1 Tax=Alsobacter metallidurans TaxID=340221 RepID=A0A917MHL1_9HYPH|nr:hypothetical protein [Alsobacter metallidurans]GGH15651.1 hypothetical protein GCM10007036_15790 [Alsobacter metallidurans]